LCDDEEHWSAVISAVARGLELACRTQAMKVGKGIKSFPQGCWALLCCIINGTACRCVQIAALCGVVADLLPLMSVVGAAMKVVACDVDGVAIFFPANDDGPFLL